MTLIFQNNNNQIFMANSSSITFNSWISLKSVRSNVFLVQTSVFFSTVRTHHTYHMGFEDYRLQQCTKIPCKEPPCRRVVGRAEGRYRTSVGALFLVHTWCCSLPNFPRTPSNLALQGVTVAQVSKCYNSYRSKWSIHFETTTFLIFKQTEHKYLAFYIIKCG